MKISRTKCAPVATASAIVLIGSHNTLTPKGSLISSRRRPMTNAIAAVAGGSASNSNGRSFSLPNITASNPAAWRAARSRAASSISPTSRQRLVRGAAIREVLRHLLVHARPSSVCHMSLSRPLHSGVH